MSIHKQQSPQIPERMAFAKEISMTKQREALVMFLRAEVASLLDIPPIAVGSKDSIFELGVDSLKAVELKNTVDHHTGLCSSTSLIYDYPNITDLAEFISMQLTASENIAQVKQMGSKRDKCLSCTSGGCTNSFAKSSEGK